MKTIILTLSFLISSFALAGPDPYISEVVLYSTPFCPRYWVEADGRELEKKNNQALFSLIGYTYGGSGDSFQIPDLREQAPSGMRYCMAVQGQYPSRP